MRGSGIPARLCDLRGITLRRHYFFSPSTAAKLGGALAGPEAWDALRIAEREPGFAMAESRARWQADCGQPWLIERGERIALLTRELGLTEIVSFGVGAGCLEYQIHRADPGLALHLSDFSGATVSRLARVFPDAASTSVLDVLEDEISARSHALALLHRIDSEFSDEDLRCALARLRDTSHRHVLLVPTMLLTLRVAAAEVARRCESMLRRRPATFVGYARNWNAFARIWLDIYEVRWRGAVGGTPFILLEAV